MTDLTTLGPAHEAGFAHAVRREVVVQQKAILALAFQGFDQRESRRVPRVATTMACVSPRVNSAEP